MSDFELAMQEFIDNGGVIETLAYRGPKETTVAFKKQETPIRAKEETELED